MRDVIHTGPVHADGSPCRDPSAMGSFDYRADPHMRMPSFHHERGSSPVRVAAAPVEAALAQAAQAASAHYTHSFSLYEQHKEQREEREHSEYQRIQTEHQRSYEINQFSQGVRDRVIATYRAEIESHKLNDRDFCSLKAHIDDLKRRREAMDSSVAALQGDFEAQLSS